MTNSGFYVGGSAMFPSQIPNEYRNDIKTGISATPITNSIAGDEINPIEYEQIQRIDLLDHCTYDRETLKITIQ